MDNNNLVSKMNPKVLFGICAVLVVLVSFVIFSFLSTKKTTPPINSVSQITPTPVARQIPQDQTIPTPAIQNPPSVLINRYGDVSFALLPSTLPTKVNLYAFVQQIINQAYSMQISTRLDLAVNPKQQETQNGTALVYSQGQRSAVFYLSAGNIQYVDIQPLGETRIGSQKEAETSAAMFIQKFSPYDNQLTLDSSGVIFEIGGGDVEKTSSFEEAEYIDVPFSQSINNIPILNQFSSRARAHVVISKDGHIQKTTINTPELLTATRQVSLLSLAAAKQKIINGDGVIARYGDINQLEALPTPQKTIFTQIWLAYFRDTASKTLYPVYVLEGSSTNEAGELPITIYLPAIK